MESEINEANIIAYEICKQLERGQLSERDAEIEAFGDLVMQTLIDGRAVMSIEKYRMAVAALGKIK